MSQIPNKAELVPVPQKGDSVVQVLLFARLSREAGVNDLSISFTEPLTVRQLAQRLTTQYGLNLAGCMVAINEEYATLEQPLKDMDEVAFLPPVSGGSDQLINTLHNNINLDADTHCELTEDTLHLQQASAFLTRADCGAQAYFLGTVRSPNNGQEVAYIDYEGFVPMAQKVMHKAAQQVRTKHGFLRIYIQHRLGRLLPAEASILLAVASPRRRAALEACDELIEYLKQELPIWKHEQSKQGATWVAGQTSHETL